MATNTSGLKRGGSVGRLRGVPNRATREAKAVCAAFVDDPEYLRSLGKRMRAGKLAPAVECMIWYYAKGKPREIVRIEDGQDGLIAALLEGRRRALEGRQDCAARRAADMP